MTPPSSAACMERLIAAGLSDAAARRKAPLFASAGRALAALPAADAQPPCALFVPGRLELLGKHTDYAGGQSIVCPVERGFCCLVRPRSDTRISAVAADTTERLDFALDEPPPARPGHWSTYVVAVARRVVRNFGPGLRGVDFAFASDLPPAAGLSSSSALIVATFLALAEANDLREHPAYRANLATGEDLAAYLGAVENGSTYAGLAGDTGVGTFGGSEDHTAILCGRPETLSRYAYCPTRLLRHIPAPSGHTFIIAGSGVSAPKTATAREQYNRAALAVQELVRLWSSAAGAPPRPLAAIIADTPEPVRTFARLLDGAQTEWPRDLLLNRLRQFVEEDTHLVPRVADALQRADVAALGPLIDRSQWCAAHLLGNQVDETSHLARSARTLGAVAASAFGAGFGGSVWALVPIVDATAFQQRWQHDYVQGFPQHRETATFFATRAGPPATVLSPQPRRAVD